MCKLSQIDQKSLPCSLIYVFLITRWQWIFYLQRDVQVVTNWSEVVILSSHWERIGMKIVYDAIYARKHCIALERWNCTSNMEKYCAKQTIWGKCIQHNSLVSFIFKHTVFVIAFSFSWSVQLNPILEGDVQICTPLNRQKITRTEGLRRFDN